ncbi:hypothetical protein [Thalassomonas actiniarum]|uniref:Uncharacterized protein n=1 Tax=Thalassomonas actiniarum TaxID=485447 RepID=A0AAE9YZS3_9GAMM|nr:hypothetical protein [Thalassomonas actiniarum]WDE02543.1 hypothetical protein SG35_029500 [Thalassomonas actiniarum]
MFTAFSLSLFLSLVIGYLGRRRRIGFWGLTFGSLLLTPIVGLILLLITDDVPQPEQYRHK